MKKLILFTSLNEINCSKILSYFSENKIYIDNIIKDCDYSEIKRIISTQDDINKLIVSDN